jgi:hypothetical protein
MLAVVLGLLLPPLGSVATAQTPLTVEWKAARLSVSAQGVSLAQILREVARRTGIEVQGLEGLQQRVSVRFADLPLREGLEKLLAQMDYAILGDLSAEGGKRPARVVVSGRWPSPAGSASNEAAEPEGEAASEEGVSGPEETESEGNLMPEPDPEEQRGALQTFVGEGNEEALRKALRDADQAVQATAFELLAERDSQWALTLLTEATKSEEPMTRLQALQLFEQSGRADEATTMTALREALADETVTVRQYAIQALATRGGADAFDSLRQTFFREADPAVKVMILESIAQQDQGLGLLQEAARDPDEAVRFAAALWLKQAAAQRR